MLESILHECSQVTDTIRNLALQAIKCPLDCLLWGDKSNRQGRSRLNEQQAELGEIVWCPEMLSQDEDLLCSLEKNSKVRGKSTQ